MHFYNLDNKYDSFSIRLRFHPTGKIGFSDSYERPLSEDLVTIPAGSVLYQVYLFAPSLLSLLNLNLTYLATISSGLVRFPTHLLLEVGWEKKPLKR